MGLEGKMHAVRILETDKWGSAAAGMIMDSGEDAVVRYANGYGGQTVLARFPLYDGEVPPVCNLVTTQIPKLFKPMYNFEYILCGMWEDDMQKEGEFPTLDEINRYYDPGDLKGCAFIGHGPFEKAIVKPKGFYRVSKKSYSHILRKKMPDADRSTRAVLVRKQQKMDNLVEAVNQLGLTPVLMERLQ